MKVNPESKKKIYSGILQLGGAQVQVIKNNDCLNLNKLISHSIFSRASSSYMIYQRNLYEYVG